MYFNFISDITFVAWAMEIGFQKDTELPKVTVISQQHNGMVSSVLSYYLFIQNSTWNRKPGFKDTNSTLHGSKYLSPEVHTLGDLSLNDIQVAEGG